MLPLHVCCMSYYIKYRITIANIMYLRKRNFLIVSDQSWRLSCKGHAIQFLWCWLSPKFDLNRTSDGR